MIDPGEGLRWRKLLGVGAICAVAVIAGALSALAPVAAVLGAGLLIAVSALLLAVPIDRLGPQLGLTSFFACHWIAQARWWPDLAPWEELLDIGRVLTAVGVVGLAFLFRPVWLQDPRTRGPLLTSIFFVVSAAAVGIYGSDVRRSMLHIAGVGALLAACLALRALWSQGEELWTAFLEVLAFTGMLSCIACAAAEAAGVGQAGRLVWGIGEAGFGGLYGSTIVLGEMAAWTLTATLASMLVRRQTTPPPWKVAAIALSILVSVSSVSRSAIIASALAVVAYLVISGTRPRPGPIVAGIAAIAGIAVLLLETSAGSAILFRLSQSAESIESGEEGRVVIAGAFLRAFLQNPLLSVGFGQSPATLDLQAFRTFGRHVEPHSFVLQYLVAPGLLAGTAFLGLLVRCWRRILASRSTPLGRSLLLFVPVVWFTMAVGVAAEPQAEGPLVFLFPIIFAATLPLRPDAAPPALETP